MHGTAQIVYWAPRILGVVLAVFVGLFAFDVFAEGYGFRDTAVAFLVHLIPAALVLTALLVGWRWEHLGGVLFLLLGVLYVVATGGRGHWLAYLLLAGPLFLIGLLFLLYWHLRPTA